MKVKRSRTQEKNPRSEPEIIPPDRTGRRTPEMRIFVDTQGAEHVYVTRVRPLGFILAMVIVSLLAIAMFILLLSTVLLWLPFVAIVAAVSIIVALWRKCFVGSG